jgi:hypothetical protein
VRYRHPNVVERASRSQLARGPVYLAFQAAAAASGSCRSTPRVMAAPSPTPTSKNPIGGCLGMARGAAGTSPAYSSQSLGPPTPRPTLVQQPILSWCSHTSSRAHRHSTGVQPGARLERVIAAMRLHLPQIMQHGHSSLVPAADGPVPVSQAPKVPRTRGPSPSGSACDGLLYAHDGARRHQRWTGARPSWSRPRPCLPAHACHRAVSSTTSRLGS